MKVDFTFSDMIAGYTSSYSPKDNSFTLLTSDHREFTIYLNDNTRAHYIYNLSEPYPDVTGNLSRLLASPHQLVYAYGTFYPAGNSGRFEAQQLIFPGHAPGVYRTEEPDWWINQILAIGNSYLKWQFNYPQSKINYHNYRTMLHLSGEKKGDYLQETDTISRMICGFSMGYMLTGNDALLEASEKGCQYLRDHMRFYDQDEDLIYWYHGIKIEGDKELKLLTSEFGYDYNSIPIYEQIYALAGPTMTYRLTGDPKILWDIEKTIKIFEKFKDHNHGGYFSHIDPIRLDPRCDSLGHNRARKNWNSISDHVPAYLINLYLATGETAYSALLEDILDCIVKYFPDYDNSPFINEKFNEDWSQDQSWAWQQNRAIIGHNLKLAWNLMRINSLKQKVEYVNLARKIVELLPDAGCDRQRGGWYDVVDRIQKPDGKHFRFAWHDRKAWWQQEQAILAYLILYGTLGDDFYLRMARESASFYNAFFLDHDDGGVYFNTCASGIPYLLGTERLKGSHSMSCYHSMELCFLAAVYTNLLITRQPMMFYFKPSPGGFPQNILRVSPDILPKGSIFIESCWIDGEHYYDFDSTALTVKLPDSKQRQCVKVKIAPTNRL